MSSSRGIALNCGLAAPPTTTTCHTPNTPEILNAIVNISFPTPSVPQQQASTPFPPSSLSFPPAPQTAQSLPSPTSYSDCSTPSSHTSPSPLNSPTGQSSVQHIQSQFIKEGLKMKVRQKLKSEPEEGGAYETNIKIKKEAEVRTAVAAVSIIPPKQLLQDLTPEDEERRRRRRERNKVAATKCRNKKKEKTTILVAESEIVEVQNASLKAEVARLDAEKRRLTTILAQHQPNCVKKRRLCTEEVPPTTTSGSQEEQYDMSHTFRRPAAPGNENSRGGSGTFGPSQEQHSYGGYSTNRSECPKKEEDDVENQGHFTFKTEAKDYKYAGGEMYSDVYNLMRQPPSLAEYSSSRGAAGLSYAGGYYDHMCLAL